MWQDTTSRCNTLHNTHYSATVELVHTATHCSALQHTATHCNTLQHAEKLCNALCNAPYSARIEGVHLQLTATHCTTLHYTATHCNTLQHTATHCNTLQRTQYSATVEGVKYTTGGCLSELIGQVSYMCYNTLQCVAVCIVAVHVAGCCL